MTEETEAAGSGADAIRAWIDKNELTELVAMLSSAVDRGDRDRIASCYAADSYDDHGAFKGSGREFADYVCAQPSEPGAPLRWHHLLGQSIFDVDGDEAWGETFFIFHRVTGENVELGFGRYIDYFQRLAGTWKLTYRRVVPERTVDQDNVALYFASSRDRNDPVYDRLRRPARAQAAT